MQALPHHDRSRGFANLAHADPAMRVAPQSFFRDRLGWREVRDELKLEILAHNLTTRIYNKSSTSITYRTCLYSDFPTSLFSTPRILGEQGRPK